MRDGPMHRPTAPPREPKRQEPRTAGVQRHASVCDHDHLCASTRAPREHRQEGSALPPLEGIICAQTVCMHPRRERASLRASLTHAIIHPATTCAATHAWQRGPRRTGGNPERAPAHACIHAHHMPACPQSLEHTRQPLIHIHMHRTRGGPAAAKATPHAHAPARAADGPHVNRRARTGKGRCPRRSRAFNSSQPCGRRRVARRRSASAICSAMAWATARTSS